MPACGRDVGAKTIFEFGEDSCPLAGVMSEPKVCIVNKSGRIANGAFYWHSGVAVSTTSVVMQKMTQLLPVVFDFTLLYILSLGRLEIDPFVQKPLSHNKKS